MPTNETSKMLRNSPRGRGHRPSEWKFMWSRVALIALFCMTCVAQADDLKLGATAPDWKDLKGTDDKPYALADFKDKDVLVIVFTCNSCPYAQDYEDRIIALVKSHCGEGKKAAL